MFALAGRWLEVAYGIAKSGRFQLLVPVSITELHEYCGDRLTPSQMALPRFLQHTVGNLPFMGLICGLFLNCWSEYNGAGEEERLRIVVTLWEFDYILLIEDHFSLELFRRKITSV